MLPFSPVASVVPVQPLQDTVEQTLASQAGGKILEQLEPGQRVRGEVASLANGIARVRIGDALLAMRLPPVFRAGDAVELTYASRLPQPTFQVSVPGSPAVARNPAAELAAGTARTAATPVQATPARAAPARTASAQVSLTHGGAASAALAAENADLPVEPLAVQARSLAPQALSQSAAVRYRAVEQAAPPSVGLPGPDEVPKLSQAARLIGALAAEFQPGKPATLAPTMPILPRPIENPGEMAAALRSTVARSGLFYESHLVSWLQGRETTDGLMLEPQNRAAAPGFAAAQPGASPAPPATHSAPPTAATPVQAAATDAARVLLGGPDGVNPSATHAPLVAQQLQVLENPSLIWRGELWPGQRLEWRLEENIEDDPEHRAATATDEAPGWSSTLLLDLPNLGRVRLGLALDAAGDFRIQLAAAGAARAALGAASNEALAALAAAGCRVRDWQLSEAEAEHGRG